MQLKQALLSTGSLHALIKVLIGKSAGWSAGFFFVGFVSGFFSFFLSTVLGSRKCSLGNPYI